ncbi:uncharacterized protein FIBRA_08989 [Fibroporia radiculosa]|uniref:Uncharacterized protein n=1 Tax=Fibroporia radiculosa TaxID=599839 RepID=J4ICN1_9APHY|nr:uncharacterized protein FIBRA_08989 [Fibroporia radiculosa]CCM06701.1 predicted protein [Fibroporia radiculosa]
MASTTILIALLLISWFLTTLLILLLTLTVFFFKETYTMRFHINQIPTPTTTPITEQALNWANNRAQVMSPIELATVPFTDLLSALLGFVLTTLLSILALTLIIPLTLCTTIQHLECKHQWAFNITTMAQHPLPHTTTTLPVIVANWDSNNPTQVAPTPYPSHLQTLEECFMAGIVEMPVPIQPILSFPSQQESDDSLLEFLNEGGFRYPFAPLPNVTCQPFLIPGPPESSDSNAIVLHQFPGLLGIPHNTLEASTRSYHVAPAQVFPSSSPINTSSSSNPDSPPAASTDSPNMPPLASDTSDNGSLDHTPNLQLLANVSKYITASEGYSSNPQEFVVYSDNIIQHPSNDVTRSW